MTTLVMSDHDGQEGNYKNALNALCQRITSQCMGKTDITYNTTNHGGQFQSTVTLVCMEGQETAGELVATEKGAEQSAAYQAILSVEQGLGELGYSLQERNLEVPASVRQAAIQAGVFTAGQNIQEAMTDAVIKGMMHACMMQVLGRKVETGDVVHEFAPATAGQLQTATLKLPTVEGDLSSHTWTGTSSPFKRDAQLDCSLKAMDSLLTDPTVGSKINLADAVPIRSSQEKKQKEKAGKREKQREAIARGEIPAGCKGKGKGKGGQGGKGKDGGWMYMGPGDFQMMAMMRMMMKGGGFGPMMKGKGKAKGKGATPYDEEA